MRILNKENTIDMAKYCLSLKREAFNAGKNASSIWYEKASTEQAIEIVATGFSWYAQNNDITLHYSGVKEVLRNANTDWGKILGEKIVSADDPCLYALIDLMLEYHSGLQHGVCIRCPDHYHFEDEYDDNDDYDNNDNNDNDDC